MEKSYRAVPAIPESWAGVNYRSKTEAKWAQTFDYLGWSHLYESQYLGGWHPDFVVERGDGGRIWIEVKPNLGEFWTATQRKMESSDLDKSTDVLAFVYEHVRFEERPLNFGRVGLWDTMDSDHWDWWWWDATLWWADDPVWRWGLAIPDIGRELYLSSDDVRKCGGIVF